MKSTEEILFWLDTLKRQYPTDFEMAYDFIEDAISNDCHECEDQRELNKQATRLYNELILPNKKYGLEYGDIVVMLILMTNDQYTDPMYTTI